MLGSLKKLQEKKKGGIRKMHNKFVRRNSTSGITLVALVVTIVILLILAGITIAMITGNNGILGKVQEAKEQTDLAGIREEVVLLWNETQIDVAGKGHTNDEIANIFEQKLKQNDPDATVTYQPANNTFEVNYKDHMFEIQPGGDLTTNRQDVVDDVKDALDKVDNNASGDDKADQLEEELQKKDPDSTAEYNPDTGNVDINHGGYEGEVDDDGNVTITGPIGGGDNPGGEEPGTSTVEITSQPTAVQAIEGQNDVTFTVVATGTGTGNLSYQWYYKTSGSGAENEIPGANGSSYTISKENVTTDLDGRYYYVKITQGNNEATTSDAALLNVAGKASITQEPASVTVTEGEKATFTVVATGEGTITYQWYKNTTNSNQGGTPIQNETKATYTIDSATADDNDTYYYVVVTQSYGSSTAEITSNAAKLTVGDGVSVSTPSDVSVIAGVTDATFTVTASGSGTFTYQWYSNTTDSNQNGTPIDGENSNTYTIPAGNVTTDLNGTYYYVEVTQDFNGVQEKVTSEAAALSVTAPTTISVNPQPVTAYENGQDVTFEVTATGEGTLTYQWYKNTTNSNQGGTPIDSATGSTYTIPKENVTQDLNGTYYYCEVTQNYGSSTTTVTSDVALLNVLVTSIDAEPSDVTLYIGGESKTVNLSGENAGTFSIETAPDGTYATAEINPDNNNELIISPVAAGKTSVVVKEENGNKTVTINITVLGTDLQADPSSLTVYVGGGSKQVQISGTGIGALSIQDEPEVSIATASINGNTLTVTPVGKGNTSVTVIEANGKQTVTINIEVKETSLDVDDTEVTLFEGGDSEEIPIEGTDIGNVTIENPPDEDVADVTIEDGKIIITPKGPGETSVTIKEDNGNQEVTIPIKVEGTTIEATNTNVIAYVGGLDQTVTLSGTNAGEFSIETPPDSQYATADLSGNTLTIKAVAEGKTTVVIKEANGNKTITINIEVRGTTITATTQSVTAYVGGSDQTVTISGTNIGELSITGKPDEEVATASISGNTLTISPKGQGQTSVTVTEANGNKSITISINVIASDMTVTNSNVTAYVGGNDQTVTINGDNIGTLSISGEPDTGVATASLSGNILTIHAVGDGKTSVEVTEDNGNNKVTVNVTVVTPSITAQNVEVYAGGSSKSVEITGLYMGDLSIEEQPDVTYATAEISGTTLTVTPKAAGTTSVLLKESNGNQTARINITVTATSIDANIKDVTLYVGGDSQKVTITGVNAGTLEIQTPPNDSTATASLDGDTLTISPKGPGTTSVTVKEGNGNQTVTINIIVESTSIDIDESKKDVILYVGGVSEQITLSGTNAGAFSITDGPDGTYATAQLSGDTLTIKPVAAGTTTITVTESNGKKSVTINVEVRQSTITATNTNVTAYVGGNVQTVTISGTYMGDLSITGNPDEKIATADLQGNTLTIAPKGQGDTSVTITESNGNQAVTIAIHVIESEIQVTNTNVIAYVGGTDQTVTVSGDSIGDLSITGEPTATVATASLSGNTVTILPKGEGTTSVEVTESNGNNKVTINVTVYTTSVNSQSIEVYVGGSSKSVEITGQHMGELTIENGPNETYATAQISGTTLTVTPKAEGNTSVTIKEANGNKTATIDIAVKETSISTPTPDITIYEGGDSEEIPIEGTNIGDISVVDPPDEDVATVTIEDGKPVVTPKGPGETSVTIKEDNGNEEVTITIKVEGTTIEAQPTSVTAYVNGNDQKVTLSGTNAGTFEIQTEPNSSTATASISGNTLTIHPVAIGTTNVTVKENNGNKLVTIPIEVKGTSISTPTPDVTVYVGGDDKEIPIEGTNTGNLSVVDPPDEDVATVTIVDGKPVITPKGPGDTSVTIKEDNGNQEVTIEIHVVESDIQATNTNVTAYVGGTDQTVAISGDNIGTLSISKQPDLGIATASLSGQTLTIHPVGAGTTSVEVKEANGNKTIEINIDVKATTIEANPTSVTAYVNGTSKTVTLSGENNGTFSIQTPSDSGIAKAEINPDNNNELIITPVAEGKTSVTVKEANGNKIVTIPIEVKQTSITATTPDVTVYVGGSDQEVPITGTNLGDLTIVDQPDEGTATATIEDGKVIISPKGEGDTSVTIREENGGKEVTITIHVITSEMQVTSSNVTAYVGGSNQTVTISGTSIGNLSITKNPEATVATASLSDNTLTISPVGDGKTSVEVTESNGNNKVTINITVVTPSITPQNVEVYAGGTSKQVTIEGLYMGTLTIAEQPDSTYATASIDGTTLTIIPKATAGTTSLLLKESNGNQTAKINITVIGTSITVDEDKKDITLYVGGTSEQVTLSGENVGTFDIQTEPNSSIASANIDGNTLTISPKGEGNTSVVVKEGNGNQIVTINIHVLGTTIEATSTNVIAYVGGADQTVTLSGENSGAFTIEKNPDGTYATAELSGNTLTITPKAEGSTSLTVKEANGNKEITINIEVRQTSITTTTPDVTLYVGGSDQEVTITGTYIGDLEITGEPDDKTAIATLSGDTLTISPKGEGDTSVTIREGNGGKEVTITIHVITSNIQASSSNVTAYVGGTDKTVTISGDNIGNLSITGNPTGTVATASISGNTLTISPKGEGQTSVEVTESNGNNKVTINVTVYTTSINSQSVEVYEGGSSKSVEITGEYMGDLTIAQQPDGRYATAEISGTTLTVTPKAAGNTNLVLKESNGNQTARINITVTATSIGLEDESKQNVTLYVGGNNEQITLNGTNAGAFEIQTPPSDSIATANISGNTLTISPKGEGDTSVVVKETNGNQTITINIKVLGTTIEAQPTSVIVYVGGVDQTVNLSGTNNGAFEIQTEPNTSTATASISGNILTIHPVAAGTTNVIVKENNGNKAVTIPIEVKTTTISATTPDITVYVGGNDQEVPITGTSLGDLTIVGQPDAGTATATIVDGKVIISPKGEGDTSVTVKEGNGNKEVTITIHVVQSNITATNTNVTAYVNGSNQTVTINGDNIGNLSISSKPDEGVATAELSGNTLTIKPVGDGKTTVEVKESNGNNTVTINVTVLATSITPQTVEVYAGGSSKQVTIEGLNMGTLTIENGPDSTYATASIDGTTLTVTPTKTAGTTSLTLKEANGGQTATINITVTATSIDIDEDMKDVTLYVNGSSSQIPLGGTNAGIFSVETGPEETVATASISDNTLTISPKGEGETSVTVKEANGNQTVTINITVKATSIDANIKDVTLYVNGNSQNVTITGTELGDLSISGEPTGTVATARLDGNTLTISPSTNSGSTSVTVKESNGNQTVTINVTVKTTSINVDESKKNITLYVGGSSQDIEINGSELGTLTTSGIDTGVATAELKENTLTIKPVGEGSTSVTVTEANGNQKVTINITVKATDLKADTESVTAYVNGANPQVKITGTNTGELSIQTPADGVHAIAELADGIVTITGLAEGQTSVTIKEANGNKTVTININVLETTLQATSTDVIAYIGGTNPTVTINGENAGTLSITKQADGIHATADLVDGTLTITPIAEGNTSVEVTEANGNKSVTINITVKETTLKANTQDVTAYIGGDDQTVEITGNNLGDLSIETPPDGNTATAEMQGNNLTIKAVGEGKTSVTIKESNGNKTITINIEVKTTTFTATNTNVTAYVGGSDQTVTLGGTNYGTLSIQTGPEETYATASLSGTTLTITPKAEGTTSVVVKEANGNKTVTININVVTSSITADPTSVTAYVGGNDQTVTIEGDNIGTLTISEGPTETVATASLSGNTLTISPKGSGTTSVTIKEANGNKTVTVNISVLATSITAQTVEVYEGGSAKTVTIEGLYMGTLTIENGPDTTKATAEISGTSLTITPKAAGTTSLVLKESNGGKTATISISVLATTITATPPSVSANISDGDQTVTIGGTNTGTLSISSQPTSTVATASLSGTTLTITPKGAGNTSVTVKEANGNKEVTISITITSKVTAPNVPSTDYGAEVKGYEYPNDGYGIGWQLFYSDDNNIYLIADDYIPYYCMPSSSGGNKPNQASYSSYPRAAYFTNVLNDYRGSASITEAALKALNNDYFTNNYTSTYNNMKAVAYMLDTDAWSVYAGDKAEYAIGGPTIELLFNSYNKKYSTNYEAQASSRTGYKISNNGGSTWSNSISNMLSTSDSTYVISSRNNAYGMWLASPSNYGNNNVLSIDYTGYVNYSTYSYSNNGFRPIVCLKSDIQLEKNDDGSYTIVENEGSTTPGGETGDTIGPEDMKPTDYGATVNGYDCENNAAVNSWKLFYADDSNIYLIADDYIPYNYIPSNAYGNKPSQGPYSKSVYFYYGTGGTYIFDGDYAGSSSIRDSKLKALNNNYFNVKRYTSTYENMKTVAYMLDTDAWSVYAGENAEYAIGGPTIELFINSYNKKYGTSYTATATSNLGYSTRIDLDESDDTLYVISSTGQMGGNPEGMWMASPSNSDTRSLVIVDYMGTVIYGGYGDLGYGFRPVVCLKSDTQLQKNSDGSFTIVDSGGSTTPGGSTGGSVIDSTSKVGYYADIEGDGTVDGIIYADLAVGGSGRWNNDSYSSYSISKVNSGLKEYYVSKSNYSGPFGTKDVISPSGSGTERFYVMALNDIDRSTHYWYYNAMGKLDNYMASSVNDFGQGKTNTTTMISKWNSKAYGAQNSNDMWGLIQTQAKNGWFVPSKSEWAAFGGELGITKSNYSGYGLKTSYWSSTQDGMYTACRADFSYGCMGSYDVYLDTYVRLSTTF